LKRLFALLSFAALVAAAVTGVASGGGRATDGGAAPTVDTGSAIVQLNGDSLATSSKTRPPAGKRIDFDSSAVRAYRAQLAQLRNEFKQWLKANAPAAKVTSEYDIALNAVAVQLNGTSLSTIRSAPQVQTAEYESLYTPRSASGTDDPDLTLINAPLAWGGNGATAGVSASGGLRAAGPRVKVAIVDTGVDQTHPCFDPTGYAYPAGFPKGDTSLTTPKVIVARVFNMMTPRFGFTPLAIQEHGTHVAGTVACDYGLTHDTTIVNGVTVDYGVNGVAPGAQLGNYNVFPSVITPGGEVDILNARSEDIMNALDAAYVDGMDVANMSLGGNSNGNQDLLTKTVNNLDAAGMVVAVAAGNSGPGHYTIESPGSAASALTAGASTVGHFIGVPITSGAVSANGAVGQFGNLAAPVTGPLAVLTGGDVSAIGLSLACTTAGLPDLTGKIALLSRGVCTFSTKIRNAQSKGAIAVIVVNNVAGDPIAMGQDGTPDQPTIPAVMVSRADGVALKANNSVTTTIGSTKQYFRTSNSNIMASFSSQGPTDVDFRVKPDVVAPGVNVLSSIPLRIATVDPSQCTTPAFGCWAFFQGTSMATPHLAGSAAVVIGQHPSWTAWEVRSAIVNTAQENVLKFSTSGACCVTDPNIIGSGLADVNAATHAAVALNPVSVTFGAVPGGSGQSRSVTITITDLTGAGGTYPVTIANTHTAGVTFTASPTTVTLGPNGTATVTITMSADKGATAGDQWATLRIGSAAHAAVYTLVK
jgi:minor extracellular serine protease Vpr